jgi:pimeloyl-ACP methyl ester carboxylesterase
LDAFLDAQDLSDVVLVGWSMGSLVAWEYVRQFGTDRFRGFVSVEQQPLDLEQEGYDHGVFDFDELRGLMELEQTKPCQRVHRQPSQRAVTDARTVLLGRRVTLG